MGVIKRPPCRRDERPRPCEVTPVKKVRCTEKPRPFWSRGVSYLRLSHISTPPWPLYQASRANHLTIYINLHLIGKLFLEEYLQPDALCNRSMELMVKPIPMPRLHYACPFMCSLDDHFPPYMPIRRSDLSH